MAIPEYFYRTSIKALILDKKYRFLLTLEKNGSWEFPGGGLKKGEMFDACLTREIKEETGLETVYINNVPSYYLIAPHSSKKWWVANVFYETKLKDLNFTPSDECVDIKFFTKNDALKENLFPNVKEFIKIFNPKNH